jgi:glycogen synthase
MPLVTVCLRLHQPFRLSPDDATFLWDQKNSEIFQHGARQCYLPLIQMFTELVREHSNFKISFSISGTFLEQAELYEPGVVDALRELEHSASHQGQVEFLEETYYHSLVSFFPDPKKTEFKEQVALHREKISGVFGVKPTAFANTGLLYDNEIANIVADMGFTAILCELSDRIVNVRDRKPAAVNVVYRARGRNGRPRKLAVLPRNAYLSQRLTPMSGNVFPTAGEYADLIHQVGGEIVVLVCDFPLVEQGTLIYRKVEEFWRALPEEFPRYMDLVPANPTEVAEWFQITSCPMVDCAESAGPPEAQTPETLSFLRSRAQRVLFKSLEDLEPEAKRAGGDLLHKYRYLTTADHLLYLNGEGRNGDLPEHDRNPYDSVATAAYTLTHAADELSHNVKSFNILTRSTRTPVIIITPETARLPSEGMGQFAKYVSGKSGGLGDVISALCKGLSIRGIPVHLVTINLSTRFREEAGLSESEWVQKRHRLNPENVHLVSSAIFEGYRSAYDGSPLANAAEFQRQTVNTYIKEIRSQYDGRAILHTNDWMAGGVIAAYAKMRGVPVLHTVHNTHTGHVPLDMFYGVNLAKLWNALYISLESQQQCVDCQATAIKSATKISYVGEKFLKEVVTDYFLDRPIIPWSVREETKIKYVNRSALVIPNGISPDVYPENQQENPEVDRPGLAKRYGPDDDIIEAKRLNLVKFQKKMGLIVDPEAILLYWPSRLDRTQKGVELIEEIAQRFVNEYAGVQIAIVGDPVGGDWTHADIMGRIACASQGRITYHRFDQDLSILGYAAASDVFGASLYEPFGQIDVVGNLYGATATNRDTGGYSDKIKPLSLRAWGAPIDSGNGVLFRNYNGAGLWWGLTATVQNHRYFREHPREWEKQARRIMRETRSNWSLDNMVARYITAYEGLNDGKPLA